MNSWSLPDWTPARKSGRHGAEWATTSNPALSRSAENAWKLFAGFGMYGRDTLVGYQKSTLTGSFRPACWSSCLDLSGLYGYAGTPFLALPNNEGGMNCVAAAPTPP